VCGTDDIAIQLFKYVDWLEHFIRYFEVSLDRAATHENLETLKRRTQKVRSYGHIDNATYESLNARIKEKEQLIGSKIVIDKTDSKIGQTNNPTHQREYNRSPI
jgi:hypothetical protein